LASLRMARVCHMACVAPTLMRRHARVKRL